MSNVTLVFASANPNKIEEIGAMLPKGYVLKGLRESGIHEDIPEPGHTIRENSYLKAAYVANFFKTNGLPLLPVFADDSGLEVEALNGAPGVYSARYAGQPKNDAENNKKLLQEMQQHTQRKARFVTVITLLMEGKVWYFEGAVSGTIAWAPRGTGGFGYDPLFVPTGYRSTFAELGPAVKNTISHRAKAVEQLVAFLGRLSFPQQG